MINGKDRLLFFDVLRIGGVALVVLCHIQAAILSAPFEDLGPLIFHVFYFNTGEIGVALMIFVSGAMLEYSHPSLRGIDKIGEFYLKRLTRIYPAYWISLIIGLFSMPYLFSWFDIWFYVEFLGFAPYIGWMHWGLINTMGWFVGLVVILYLLFPVFSSAIRKYPAIMLCLFAFVEITSRYFLNVYHPPMLGYMPDRYLPFCNFLEFGLGIFIVQQNIYPKTVTQSKIILYLAEISFYVYLVNYYVVIRQLPATDLIEYLVIVAVLAVLVKLGDDKVQEFLKKRFFTGNTS